MSDLKISKNIKLVCWDFDKTILNYHTGGVVLIDKDIMNEQMRFLSEKISSKFVEQFVYFFKKGVKQVVVTFGDSIDNTEFDNSNSCKMSGDRLLKKVFETYIQTSVLLNEEEKKALVEIPVFGFYPPLRQKIAETESERQIWLSNNNKNVHLQMAMDLFETKEKSEVLLIDDCIKNINQAESQGYNVFHVSDSCYSSFLELQE